MRTQRTITFFLVLFALAIAAPRPGRAQTCEPVWTSSFPPAASNRSMVCDPQRGVTKLSAGSWEGDGSRGSYRAVGGGPTSIQAMAWDEGRGVAVALCGPGTRTWESTGDGGTMRATEGPP